MLVFDNNIRTIIDLKGFIKSSAREFDGDTNQTLDEFFELKLDDVQIFTRKYAHQHFN